LAFNKFKNRRDEYYDPFEPVIPSKPTPPTPRDSSLEGTVAYQNVETAEEYKIKIEALRDLIAPSLETEPSQDEPQDIVQEEKVEALTNSQGEIETYETVDIRKAYSPGHLMYWDIGYQEYLSGLRVEGKPIGAWIQRIPEFFSNATYEPFFLTFGQACEHGKLEEGVVVGEGVNFEEVRFLFPNQELVSDLESLEKFIEEGMGEDGSILYLRFEGAKAISHY